MIKLNQLRNIVIINVHIIIIKKFLENEFKDFILLLNTILKYLSKLNINFNGKIF